MSFARVKPGDWALNEKLTSAQQNQLDINVSNAVDKTGDTVTGVITLASGARIDVGSGATIKALSGGAIDVLGTAQLNVYGGGTIAINDGFLTVQAAGSAVFGCLIQASGGIFGTTAAFTGDATIGGLFGVTGAASFGGALTVAGTTTTNGALVTNGTTTHAAGVTCQSGLVVAAGVLDVQAGASLLIQGAAGVSHANASNDTYQTGSNCTHATGSNDTYQSGSNLTIASGANLTINTTPTLSAGANITGGTLTTGASTTSNLNGTITVKGSSNRILLDSRDVTRVAPYRLDRAADTFWQQSPASSDGYRVLVAGAQADIALDLPHNAILKTISITMQIFGPHAGFPGSMPRWTLFSRILGTPVITSLGSRTLNAATDFGNNLALYTSQVVTIANTSPLAGVTIDRQTRIYFVRLFTEDGANALAGSQFLGMTLTYGVSSYDEG